MIIKKVTIHNFKSIRNDLVLDVDKKITALVGASESGKTNVLKALQKFNREAEYEEDDFCTFCGEETNPDFQMISIVFAVTPEEKKMLQGTTFELVGTEELTVAKCFGGHYLINGDRYPFAPSPDTPVEIREFLDNKSLLVERLMEILGEVYGQRAELTPQLESSMQALHELAAYLSQGDQFTPLRRSEGVNPFAELLDKWRTVQDSLTQLPEQTSEIETTTANLSGQIEAAPETLARLLEPPPTELDILDLVPEFVYLHDRDLEFLEDSVTIPELEGSPEKHNTMMKLLAFAGLTTQDLKLSDDAIRERKLVRAYAKVNQTLNQTWLQEPEISLRLIVSDNALRVHIRGRENHYGRLSDRSEGFRWFLAFYLNFVASSREMDKTVLLLDEPGIHIHAAGQKNLLDGFEEIAKSVQIVYATHSPYMINKNFPQRIRAVLKGGPEQGTHVDNKAYRPTKGGPYEPIRSAIGLSLGNSLFLGMKNLIVEGIADHILLAAVSRRFASEGEEALDLQEVCITLAGGAQNVPYLAYLASHEDMKTVVLLDSDAEGEKAAKRIDKEGVFNKDNVIRIGDAAIDKKGRIPKTLEDLFEPWFYQSAIEAAYKDVKGPKFVLPELPQAGKKGRAGGAAEEGATNNNLSEPTDGSEAGEHRISSDKQGIVKQYSNLFEEKELGDFDKVLVAKKVTEMLDENRLLDEKSLKRFKKLFKLITQRLE